MFFSQTLNMPVLDGVASVGVGLILGFTAFFLAAESQSLLTGEAAAPIPAPRSRPSPTPSRAWRGSTSC
uniref:Uncharacterized protein n=1 Tax=Phenylobacterium glaciei TaxID=2803784 RepID=A0A974S8A0_9CAUL|nr:hypothetical protein JKL49_21795 [Phenylobacterium glaciei]